MADKVEQIRHHLNNFFQSLGYGLHLWLLAPDLSVAHPVDFDFGELDHEAITAVCKAHHAHTQQLHPTQLVLNRIVLELADAVVVIHPHPTIEVYLCIVSKKVAKIHPPYWSRDIEELYSRLEPLLSSDNA